MSAVRDEAFERLFEEEFERCQQVAWRIVWDRAVAEELAAEAFARAWARWARLRSADRVGGWVLRVTANLAVDVVRRGSEPKVAPGTALPSEDVSTLRMALVKALRSLPRRQREAIALRYLADLSEEQVSSALGMSAGSVKTHIHRGLARLRRVIDPNDDPEVFLAFKPR